MKLSPVSFKVSVDQKKKNMVMFPVFCAFSLKFTLSLKTPLKANWFSGLPSGTLYRLNQSTVASRYPGLFCRTSSMPASHQREENTLKVGNGLCICWSFLRLLGGLFPTVIVVGIGVVSIDHNDLPVSFCLIDQSQCSQHLHFDYFPTRAHLQI